MLYLQDQGVFEFYYITKDANGQEIETWQSALQDLVFAANLNEELKMDIYNESVANALLDIMHTLQTNTAFYPLEHYEKTPASVYNIPFDRVLFLACTYNAALNEQFNVNPSHHDALRGPYYSGEKNIYDFMQVSQDFNLVWGFNYIMFFLIAYGIWKEMWYILLDCMARIYNMVILYLVGPPFIALSPLDGGGKTKQWMTAFTVQCFGIFGTVVAMRLLLTFAPIIISTQLEIFPNAIMDIVAKCMLVYGCAFTSRKASAMFSGILADEYVDKTALIALVNEVIGTPRKLVCATRPRRFGKTFAAESLVAYYSCGCESRELFDGLSISRDPSFEHHLNAYNVVQLDMTAFRGEPDVAAEVTRVLLCELRDLCPDAGMRDKGHVGELTSTLTDIVDATGRRFVFVIDEWDAPLRERRDNASREDWVFLLRLLFKNATFTAKAIAAAYMTGILPVIRYGTQSALSDFDEYTFLAPSTYAPYVGFTEAEVDTLAARHNLDIA
jgi:hypothetical protein